jgi:hypothetical protein
VEVSGLDELSRSRSRLNRPRAEVVFQFRLHNGAEPGKASPQIGHSGGLTKSPHPRKPRAAARSERS